MAQTQQDRVKASKLRKRRNDGKPLNDADRIWLADYEKNHGTGYKKKPTTPAVDGSSQPMRDRKPVVTGPQLAIEGTSTVNGPHVHETKPESSFTVDESTWIPTVPTEAPDTEPPPDGAPPPPKAGSPIVDDVGDSATGDPAAAQQFAALVKFFTMLGMRAGRELAADMELPADVRVLLESDELTAGALETVGGAAERLAMKWGFRSVPLGDEAIVLAALVGSGVLVAKNMKRKQLEPKKPNAQTEERREQPMPPTPLDSLWGR